VCAEGFDAPAELAKQRGDLTDGGVAMKFEDDHADARQPIFGIGDDLFLGAFDIQLQ